MTENREINQSTNPVFLNFEEFGDGGIVANALEFGIEHRR